MTMLIRLSSVWFALCLLCEQGLAQDRVSAIASPAYSTMPPLTKELRSTEAYEYTQRLAEPEFTVEPLTPLISSTTPAGAFVARVSAMMRGDYQEWLDSWDSASRTEIIDSNALQGWDDTDWIGWWAAILGSGRFVLQREIQSGQYVILTYKLRNVTTLEESPVEFPMVFVLDGDSAWPATQDLSDDSLLSESPWVDGRVADERVVQ